jgi:hypothetical protein
MEYGFPRSDRPREATHIKKPILMSLGYFIFTGLFFAFVFRHFDAATSLKPAWLLGF